MHNSNQYCSQPVRDNAAILCASPLCSAMVIITRHIYPTTSGNQYDVSQCRAGTPSGKSCVVKCRPGYVARQTPATVSYPSTNSRPAVAAGTYTCTDVRLVGTWRGQPPICSGTFARHANSNPVPRYWWTYLHKAKPRILQPLNCRPGFLSHADARTKNV
jgi:hypothetical protein